MKQRFYSNGKLLITGEYVVLDGAKALALPVKFGQDLVVESGKNQSIHWKSFDQDGSVWFEDTIRFESIKNKESFEDSTKNTLIQILHAAFLINPKWLEAEGYVITTQLTFPRHWGLGTSSTLINNIAQWLNIDAYVLLRNSFGGSGYDIACAQHDTPIMYQRLDKPIVTAITFNPSFKNHLYFVYLNRKQNSQSAIASYKKKEYKQSHITAISLLTQSIIKAPDRIAFSALIENHEDIMCQILGQEKVKTRLFPDCNGTIKSLGAWGGDFILVVAEEDPTAYFKQKGYETVLPYSDIIL